MPSQAAANAVPEGVTPRRGKGALGTWRAFAGPVPGHRARVIRPILRDVEPAGKPIASGAYAGQRLSFDGIGKAC